MTNKTKVKQIQTHTVFDESYCEMMSLIHDDVGEEK